MSNLKVKVEVHICEIDGKDVPIGSISDEPEHVTIRSHWVQSNYVIIEYKGKSITVAADDITKAIQNCSGGRV